MTTVNKSIIIAASPETVWEYLTNKDKLGEWFHPARANLAAGQNYELFGEDGENICWGSVQDMQAASLLTYTFTIKPLGGGMTTVTWKLDEIPGGTKLSLTHDGISQAAGEAALGLLMALDTGWEEHLGKMRKALTAKYPDGSHTE